jgi:GT2 family glycosyltransferase
MTILPKTKGISYVLISPARNEEGYIGRTLDAVVRQTLLPKRWVIVSDGSTDRTEEIVRSYALKHEFILLLRLAPHNKRSFSSKVHAFQAGLERLEDLHYDFIGNLDADVSFDSHYFEYIRTKFIESPKLGIAGGVILEDQENEYRERPFDRSWNVAGAIQLFRRRCFEQIGGFVPLKVGGEDTVAQIMARMKGWDVRSFPELRVLHHKPTGSGQKHMWRSKIDEGIQDRMVGYHPIYELAKCLRRITEKPYFLGGILRLFGFVWSALKREEIPLPEKIVRFHRNEQKSRIKSQIQSLL